MKGFIQIEIEMQCENCRYCDLEWPENGNDIDYKFCQLTSDKVQDDYYCSKWKIEPSALDFIDLREAVGYPND